MTRLLFHKHEHRQRWEFLRWLHSGLVVSVTPFFMSEGLYSLLDDRILNKLQIFELNFAFCLLIWIINEFRYDEPENFPETRSRKEQDRSPESNGENWKLIFPLFEKIIAQELVGTFLHLIWRQFCLFVQNKCQNSHFLSLFCITAQFLGSQIIMTAAVGELTSCHLNSCLLSFKSSKSWKLEY